MNYFRITGYNPKENFCFIMDSNGKFNALWEFSAYVVEQGLEIIKASKEEKFLDGNIAKAVGDLDRQLTGVKMLY